MSTRATLINDFVFNFNFWLTKLANHYTLLDNDEGYNSWVYLKYKLNINLFERYLKVLISRIINVNFFKFQLFINFMYLISVLGV